MNETEVVSIWECPRGDAYSGVQRGALLDPAYTNTLDALAKQAAERHFAEHPDHRD